MTIVATHLVGDWMPALRLQVLAIALLFGRAAEAAPSHQIRDVADGFILDVAPTSARVCAVHPGRATDDPICRQLDTEPIRLALAPGVEAVVVVHGSRYYVLTHSVYPTMPGGRWVDSVVTRTKEHHPAADVRPKSANLVSRDHIGLAEVMRVDLVVADPSDRQEHVEVTSWLIPGRDAFHVFDVQAPASLAEIARADFQQALPTLSLQLSPYAILWVAVSRFWYLPLGASALAVYLLVRKSKPATRP